jgi:DNA primase
VDALTVINEHIDMEKLLEHYDFDKIDAKGSMIRACCKLHGGSNPTSFVVNTRNNLWYCHTGGCGGGDAYTLTQKIEQVDFPTSVRIVAELFGINIDNLDIKERMSTYVEEMKKWTKTMQKFNKKATHNEYIIPDETRPVTKFRQFKPETLAHFGLQHVELIHLLSREDKPYVLRNRLVFPITNNGIQIGVSLRRVKTIDVPKWSHQPVDLETRELLYNYDAIQGLSTVVIVEGIIDVWAYFEIGVQAVCTFGAHVTDEQYRLLMKTGADLIWSFDGDKAGRTVTEQALELFRNKANQYVVSFEEGEDPASIEREELKRRYVASKRRI